MKKWFTNVNTIGEEEIEMPVTSIGRRSLVVKHFFFAAILFVVLVTRTTRVEATSTTVLEIGYFDASFNYLPINGSFVYRPSSNVGGDSSSLLNVILKNRSSAVCGLDLSNSPSSSQNYSNNNTWKIINWSLTSKELSCGVGGGDRDDESKTKTYPLPHTVNENETIVVRFGNEKLNGCLANFTIYNDEVVKFNCIPSADGRSDSLSPFYNEHIAFGRESHVKCYGCGALTTPGTRFPTPGPFLPARSLNVNNNESDDHSPLSSKVAYVNSTSVRTFASNDTEENATHEVTSTSSNTTDNSSVIIDNMATKLKSSSFCDSHPCLNNGTCREITESNVSSSTNESLKKYQCDCTVDYFGANCQNFNSCYVGGGTTKQQILCHNGGTCVSFNETTKCLCSLNYTGPLCENELINETTTTTNTTVVVDACASKPCLNNGTCFVISASDFHCRCPPNWNGDKICSRPPQHGPTASNCTTQCNQGACQPDGTCDCTNTGFTGKYCNEDVNECSQQNPCRNEASCNNTNGSYECICVSGYSGKNCTEVSGKQTGGKESSTNVGAIVGGIFGALAFIGLVVGGVFLFRYFQRSRKLKGKYNPAKEEMNNAGGSPLPMSTLTTGERLI